jgi:hypothetical protein
MAGHLVKGVRQPTLSGLFRQIQMVTVAENGVVFDIDGEVITP